MFSMSIVILLTNDFNLLVLKSYSFKIRKTFEVFEHDFEMFAPSHMLI